MFGSNFWRGFFTRGVVGTIIGTISRRQLVPEGKESVTSRLTERAKGIIQRRNF